MKKRICAKIMLAAILMMLFANVMVAANTGGETMPWEDGLTKIMNNLSGPTAKIIGVILIVGAGIALAVTEGQAIKKVAWVVVGLGIALNATSFLTMMFGNASGWII